MYVLNKLALKKNPKKVLIKDSRVEITFPDGTVTDYYAPDAYRPDDELEEYFRLVRNKFLDGRDRHSAQGSKTYKADTPWELQGELLDTTGYSAVLFFELDRLKKDIEVLKKEKGI